MVRRDLDYTAMDYTALNGVRMQVREILASFQEVAKFGGLGSMAVGKRWPHQPFALPSTPLSTKYSHITCPPRSVILIQSCVIH